MRGKATVKVSTNVEDVISDIQDVKGDLRDEFSKRMGKAVRKMEQDAKMYVEKDPDNSGQLKRSIGTEFESNYPDGMEWTVSTDEEVAPYAVIVEFGSGQRSGEPFEGGTIVPPPTPDQTPPGFPYKSPGIDLNSGKFDAFVSHIEQWMREKQIAPQKESYHASASAIATTIITQGTYAHPFMRPAWYRNENNLRKAARNAVRNAMR